MKIKTLPKERGRLFFEKEKILSIFVYLLYLLCYNLLYIFSNEVFPI
jgi:hypothetical protein